ncbi:hypothetical protein [Embleya sp. NPDC020886]|uniref:hypothetical protein n=1 Tax=Embleya sp. NPDC020886 TaxID=3363980 RepID=UPI0037A1E4FA
MYGARAPLDPSDGYHSETINSRARAAGFHGSDRERSTIHTDVVPIAEAPEGAGTSTGTGSDRGTWAEADGATDHADNTASTSAAHITSRETRAPITGRTEFPTWAAR